jgi:hypothetical protein
MMIAAGLLAPNHQVDGKTLGVGSSTQYPKKKAKTIWARQVWKKDPAVGVFASGSPTYVGIGTQKLQQQAALAAPKSAFKVGVIFE